MPWQAGMRNVLKADVSAGTWVVICKSNDIIFYRPVCQHHSHTEGGQWTHKWRLCPKSFLPFPMMHLILTSKESFVKVFCQIFHTFDISIIILWSASYLFLDFYLQGLFCEGVLSNISYFSFLNHHFMIRIMFLSWFSIPNSLLWGCSANYFSFSLEFIYRKLT